VSWFAAAGVELEKVPSGPTFTLESLAIEAAIKGQGIVLVNTTISGEDIAGGRLVMPFDLTVETAFAYWFVCPKRYAARPLVAAFRDWVMVEAEEERRRLGEA
jgi:LysR family transcriptional regulator, glycine cleavage system transcriptional activator